jgi:phage terminase large subunit GpA-like protein
VGDYADAARLVASAFDALLPPQRLSVAQFCAEHRWLSNAGGGTVGRMSYDIVPYLVEPQDCLTSLDFDTVAVVGPGQSAKSTIGENWVFASVGGEDPGSFLWYMQTDEVIEAFVKDRVEPMILDHALLRDRQGLRAIDDSLHFKRFRGMSVQFLAGNKSNLISKSAPRIIADEVDAWPKSLGDFKALLDIRRQTFGAQSTILALSHPDLATGLDPDRDWTTGIMSVYGDSDRRGWYWPCPYCNGFSSPAPGAARRMTLVYPEAAPLDEIEEAARLSCPCCDRLIEDRWRREMNRSGVWVGEGEEIDDDGQVRGRRVVRKIAGFWIVGAMSPFVKDGLGGLARARVKAEREAEISGDEISLRQVMSKQWGIPHQPKRAAGDVDAAALRERAEGYALGEVPEGVGFLVASIDVNQWFDVMVRGFGGGESWIVDRFRISAVGAGDKVRAVEPGLRPEDWDVLVAQVIGRRWPLAADPTRGMALRCVAIDAAGAPGVTDNAYDAWRRWTVAGINRKHGMLKGRPLYDVLPVRGLSLLTAPRLRIVFPDRQRADRKAQARGEIPLGEFNPNLYKDTVSRGLARADVGKGRIHLPKMAAGDASRHGGDLFDEIVAEQRDKAGRWDKRRADLRNEALDGLVMTQVVAEVWGHFLIDWNNPPMWARQDSNNPLIGEIAQVVVEPVVPVSAPQPPAPANAARRIIGLGRRIS